MKTIRTPMLNRPSNQRHLPLLPFHIATPVPLCRENGASTLDQRTTSTSPNGRQCADSYGSFQQSVTQTKRHTQDGVAVTFTRPQPNQKHLEVNDKPNIKALPTSKFRRPQARYLVLLEQHSPWHPQ
ncbi:hypothetical protein O181_081758 [Austropuccinia psidii MF-1]|uniref:Uncharacterized protein n=1 Tax=Austropuccinia psidii MF-1 TaxID=1389203 RepID=A0A9Q3FL75_9BASI|nr:hypothetical protein [Austropuccinia psidii MF-1]